MYYPSSGQFIDRAGGPNVSAFNELMRANLAPLAYVHAMQALMASGRVQIYDTADWASSQEPEIWNQIRRDACAAGAIENRRKSVTGLDGQVVAGLRQPDEGDLLVANAQTYLMDQIPFFRRTRYNLTEAEFRGSSFAYITGSRKRFTMPGDDREREWWVPGECQHVERWRFRLEVEAGRKRWMFYSFARRAWEPWADPEHYIRHYYERTESDHGYGRGLLNSLYVYFKAKELCINSGLTGLRKWGTGILVAAIKGMSTGSTDRSNDRIQQDWLKLLHKMIDGDAIVHDSQDEFRIERPNVEGLRNAVEFAKYFDSCIKQVCISSDLTTGQGDSNTGTYAQSQTQADEKTDYLEHSRQDVAESITEGPVKLAYHLNLENLRGLCAAHGERLGVCGKYQIGFESRMSAKEAIEVIEGMKRARMRVVESWAHEQVGAPLPSDDKQDDILPADDLGGGMFGGLAGDGQPPAAAGGEQGQQPEGAERDPEADPLEDTELAPDASAEDQAASELLGKVGGITGWMQIAASVTAGELDRDAAIAAVQAFFRLSEEDAQKLIPEPAEQQPGGDMFGDELGDLDLGEDAPAGDEEQGEIDAAIEAGAQFCAGLPESLQAIYDGESFVVAYRACKRGQSPRNTANSPEGPCTPKKKQQARERIGAGKKRTLRKRRGSALTKEQRAAGAKVRDQVLGRARMNGDASSEAVANALDNADWWAGQTKEEAAMAVAEMANAVEQDDFDRFYAALSQRAPAVEVETDGIRSASTPQEADSLVADLFASSFPDGLSEQQASSIEYYTEDGYQHINADLRSGGAGSLDPALKTDFEVLDAMTKQALSSPVKAYRGFGSGSRSQAMARDLLSAGAGSSIQLAGINSWSASPQVAQRFSSAGSRPDADTEGALSSAEALQVSQEENASVIVSSVLTEGAPVSDDHSSNPGEAEILSKHNGRFVVDGYRLVRSKFGDPTIIVDIREQQQ